ncbi:MAG: STAS domain-containing protein [Sporomusaceae bacterium]|nr:STAS domain-containing protein [Sporomusaceae bacterium]
MDQEFSVVQDQVIVTLSGGLFVEDAAALRETLISYIERGYKSYLVDLSRVDYIDSSGLGVLVAIQKRALQKGGGITIKGLQGVVREVFELTRLTKVFEIA